MGRRTHPEKARHGRRSIEGIGERQKREKADVGKKRLEEPANCKQTWRLIEKKSSIRRMSGKEGDKGMHTAAKSSLSGARKGVRRGTRKKKSKRNRHNLLHNRIND